MKILGGRKNIGNKCHKSITKMLGH